MWINWASAETGNMVILTIVFRTQKSSKAALLGPSQWKFHTDPGNLPLDICTQTRDIHQQCLIDWNGKANNA